MGERGQRRALTERVNVHKEREGEREKNSVKRLCVNGSCSRHFPSTSVVLIFYVLGCKGFLSGLLIVHVEMKQC